MTFQNFLDTVKAVIRGKFISLQAYLNKQEKPQVNNLALNLNQKKKNTNSPSQQKKDNNNSESKTE